MVLENNDLWENGIDYYFLSKALYFYRDKKKYNHIQVPWSVPLLETMLTCPDESFAVKAFENDSYFVGSAEQSFLYLDRRNLLQKDYKFVACTPCFRNEKVDKWHQKTFEKVELFLAIKNENPEDILNMFINDALECFNDLFNDFKSKKYPLEIEKTDIGYDINYAGIELGSYGIRKNEEHGLHWVYGTGVAEPRFSNVLKMGYNL
jgi:seryl-tRNA synthetase